MIWGAVMSLVNLVLTTFAERYGLLLAVPLICGCCWIMVRLRQPTGCFCQFTISGQRETTKLT